MAHTLTEKTEWPTAVPQVFTAALDSPRSGSIVFGPDLKILHTTSRVEHLLGLDPDHLAPGAELLSMLDSADLDCPSRARLISHFRQCTENCRPEQSTVNLAAMDGSRSTAVETRGIGPECWISTFEDVTLRRRMEQHLLDLASRDPLTGLANRARFEQRLSAALVRNPPSAAAVLLIDLDRFKAVNDTLGYPAGDGLLRLVGQRLQSALHPSTLIARIDGDEFAVLLTEPLLPDQLAALAARLVDLIRRTYLIDGQIANIGASIGIAFAPQDATSGEALLKSAGLALYQAKAYGGNCSQFFDPSMELRAEARRSLEFDLRKALPLRQMEVHYYPQVDIATSTLVGIEATLRWRHPQQGLKEACEFLPLATELGLAGQLADWTLRTACRDAADWPFSTPVSVAACLEQFQKLTIVESVRRALESSSLPATRLEVSVTEDVLVQDEECILSILHALRNVGVRVAMNEFGSGCASLCQLASFPFDRVSINRALLGSRFGNRRRKAIVGAIASLGASLGIPTMDSASDSPAVIHTVESEPRQGYFPAQPVPANKLLPLIADLTCRTWSVWVPLQEEVHASQSL